MTDYIKSAAGALLVSLGIIIGFNHISGFVGPMIPFLAIIGFWIMGLILVLVRVFEWYKQDLLKRTQEHLEKEHNEEKTNA